jgi:hypothetical protein
MNNKCKFSNSPFKLINNNLQFIVEEVTGAKILATIPYLKKPSFKKIANILEKYDFIKNL